MNRRMLLALLVLALPLLACSGADVVGDAVGVGVGAVVGHNLCVKACQDVDLEFYKYKHGDSPDCWCVKQDGEKVLLW